MALDTALSCPGVIFTSPAAVRFAVRQRTFVSLATGLPTEQRFFALGEATQAALRQAGIKEVDLPEQATTEGLLAMPAMQSVRGQHIGVITAPDGRGLLLQRLREGGANLAVAEVYSRMPARLNRSHHQRLLAMRGRGAVCVTSAEALGNVLAALSGDAGEALRRCVAVVSSQRLEAIALGAGFTTVVRAQAPSPRSLLDALRAHASAHGFR